MAADARARAVERRLPHSGAKPSGNRGTDPYHHLAILVVSTSFTHLIARYDPYTQNYTHVQEGPTWAHFFGTDNLGRDNWSRVLTGVQISLQIGIGTQIIVLIVGVFVGVAAALGGRTSDNDLDAHYRRHLCLPGPALHHI